MSSPCHATTAESTDGTAGDRRRAFSLVELLVVLAIMALLSAAVLPSLASAGRGADLKGTAANLTELLLFAYSAAIAQRQAVEVDLDAARRECRVLCRGVALPWLDRQPEPGPRVLKRLTWPEGIRVDVLAGPQALASPESASRGAIVFASTGELQDVTIELTDAQGAQMHIEVGALDGPVRLKGGPGR